VLWQRIARRGARFGRVSDTLAYYAFRPDSLSSDPLPLLREALRCIALGHGVDLAITGAVHASGRPSHEMAGAQLHYICWIAGMLIGRGDDAVALLDVVPPTRTPPAPMWIAESLVRSVPHSLGVVPEEWPERWHALLPRLEPFLAAVERHVGMPGYARAARVAMERAVALHVTEAPMTLGLHHVDFCECTEAIVDRVAPAGCERYAVHVLVRGDLLGVVELPVIDGMVRASVLRDVITATLAWPLLGRFFEDTHYQRCSFHDDDESYSAWRDGERIASGLPADVEARRLALHDALGWDIFLRDLWDEGEDDMAPTDAADGATPVAIGEWTVFEASAPRRALQLSDGVADVLVQVGGVSVATLRLEGEGDVIPATELPQRIGDAIGFELCRAVVREALVGRGWAGTLSLRARLQLAATGAEAAGVEGAADAAEDAIRVAHPSLAPGWLEEIRRRAGNEWTVTVLARRDRRFIGGSGDRTYAIAASGLDLALQLEREGGTPVIEPTPPSHVVPNGASPPPHGALYLPSLRWRHVGTPTMVRAISSFSGGHDERVEDDFDADTPAPAGPASAADRLPILMYHRVAMTGPSQRARWRVTPTAFAGQMQALAERGFCTIRLADWQRAMDQGRPLPERPILLTFDDGYADFADHAWPLLRRHGFGALAFLVSGSVGRHNSWDADATTEPLMDWDVIRRLRDEGVEFGAHSVTHRRFTVLSPSDAFEEAARSRQRLEDELQLPVDTFAYPYGAEDPVTRHVVGAAGFQFGLSVRSGPARRNAPWLALPRIEVTGEDDVRSLLAKLDE
ncbi:MAG: polysaccharide deacetylase family protein, partial [Gemmatimonadota bacterium]